ncbi:hypothetical protein CANARDRAFT_195421 [[Candida] arabinofermentans NRRL YB-2248]|uniref:Uncharacterized protein n=1 Tax=[Candida] arabinofermentans NRRL YB-2248 TaxID=983967 RepID=A0A1E4T5A4_9ASCO|nr:hypothetical protein CANARDRAFT_195421 [[Candida] arabinofermentans NRRL YB-2248]
MFSLEEVQLQFQIQTQITKLLVKNNMLYLMLVNGLIYRIDLDNPEKVDKVQIDLNHSTVTNAYLDPNGYHLIVQTSNAEYYYLNIESTSCKQLTKLKNTPVVFMLFQESMISKTSTGPILIATLTGLIFELNIDNAKERLFKQVWKSRDSILGLCGVKLDESKDEFQLLVALSNNKLLQFKYDLPKISSSSSSMFTSFFKKDPLNFSFNSLISFTKNLSVFAFLDINEDDSVYQLVYGNSNFRNKNDLQYLKLDPKYAMNTKSLLLTRYHILLLLNTDELIIYNQLNGEEVSRQSVPVPENESANISGDYLAETYWLHSSYQVYELVVNNENSDIWKIMTEKSMFDEALTLLSQSPGSYAVQQDMILIAKGNHLLKTGKYEEAAKVLGKTSESFENTALQLMELKNDTSLRSYLMTKLNHLPKSFSMQRTMISSWLVESYIEKLNGLDNQLLDKSIADCKKEVLESFHQFLNEYKDLLDKETTYQIIISHNRKEELLYYSNLISDYEFVLSYYLNLQEWDKALHVLTLQQKPILIYKCSTALLINYPVKTIDTWIRLVDELDFKKLLPSILTYNKSVSKLGAVLPEHNQGIRFLKFLIKEKQVKDRIVHNTLLSILITYPNLPNENLILKYLENQQTSKNLFGTKNKNFDILFDTDFILRLCFKHKKIQSAIYIYSMLENYTDAINLALDNELIEVAILVADKPVDPSSMERKMLWIKISEKLIQKVIMNNKFLEQHQRLLELNFNDKIKNLLKFLMNKCDLLTMKDLLPLFPDFIVIDNFKEEIVKSLEHLSLEMNKLSNEMTASINQSEKINKQITDFHDDHFQIIEPKESCLLCNKILIIRKFIIFPCLHSFHQDCLVKDILDSNDYKFKNAIYKLQKKIMLNKGNKDLILELRTEIDELLSTKCCLCSDIKINSIDEPLVKGDDKEQNAWDL